MWWLGFLFYVGGSWLFLWFCVWSDDRLTETRRERDEWLRACAMSEHPSARTYRPDSITRGEAATELETEQAPKTMLDRRD